MDRDELDAVQGAVRSSPDVDLPADRQDLELLGTFLERNRGFDTSAPDEKYEALLDLYGTDHDVYLPETEVELRRLVDLLQRHDDLQLLAKLLEADDTVALLGALGHGDGQGAAGAATGGAAGEARATATDPADDGDDGGLFSSEDDDDEDLLDHEDLDQFGERLSYAAGGLVCLAGLVTSVFTGFTVYKDVDSWVLSVDLHDPGAVLLASAIVALVGGLAVGFVYRGFSDDVYDGYRNDLAAATFEVPLFALIAAGLLYFLAPIVTNLVALNLVDAVLYLVGIVIVLFIAGVPLLIGVFLAVGLVVGLPAYAGILGGTLAGVPLAALTGE